MTKHDRTMTRREFIGWSARFLLLGGLLALVFRHGSPRRKTQDVCTDPKGYCRTCAALVFRRRNTGSGKTTQDTCTDPKGYCRTCSALKYCGHPTARSFKAAVRQEDSRS